MSRKLVYLTGFMASGKSTVGPILANTLGWNFYDLDELIEIKSGKSVREIFERDGELAFRNLEKEILMEVSSLEKFIIALGGGTIIEPGNLEIIKSSGLLIYLESSPEETYKRVRFKRDRPALLFEDDIEPTKEEFLERINSILTKRLIYYNQADYKLNTDNLYVGDTVEKLAAIIKKELLIEKD
jgi:shikimate kinase